MRQKVNISNLVGQIQVYEIKYSATGYGTAFAQYSKPHSLGITYHIVVA